jgi:Rps23 Pro-64 3,4-dihydroxylase Tpa1-like proline 4-hydroxylase
MTMIFKFNNVKNLPIAIIDDFYSCEELKLIYQELFFLNNELSKMYPPLITGSAQEDSGQYLKNNIGISLDCTYSDRNISNILTLNRKLFYPDFIKLLEQSHIFFRYLQESSSDKTKVHYFGNGSYYKNHRDGFVLTALSWFYKKPKKFLGGDLVIENLKIDCIENRMVIFPSILDHEVLMVEMTEEDENQKNGRYCITQFIKI